MTTTSDVAQREAEEKLLALYSERLDTTQRVENELRLATGEANSQFAAAHQARLQAQAALDALRKAFVVSNHGLQRSFQLLQSDLLVDIFTRGTASAFVVAAVCKHWRAAALSSGRVWSRVRVDGTRKHVAWYDYVETVLERSGEAVLDVELREIVIWNFDNPLLDEDQVLALFRRARNLTIVVESNADAATHDISLVVLERTLLAFTQAAMPALEEFVLLNYSKRARFSSQAPLLSLAPNLRRIEACGLDYESLDSVHLPNLQEMRLQRTTGQPTMSEVAQRWPNIRILSIPTDRHTPGHTLEPANFPMLEELDVVEGGAYAAIDDLRVDCLPRLRVLSLSSAALPKLSTFLGSGTCTTLERLSLRGPCADVLLDILARLPRLAHLRIADGAIDDWAKHVVATTAPALRTLELDECPLPMSSAQLLISILQSRAEHSKLSELIIVQRAVLRVGQQPESAFPVWLRPRLEQLVNRVVLDVDSDS